jgi:hypothetical protein
LRPEEVPLTFLRVAAVLLVLAVPVAASAVEVCLVDDANDFVYVFPKLKPPRKPDSAVAVAGLALSAVSVNALPVSGTLIRDRNTGKLFLGLTRFYQRCLVEAQLEDDLSGSVSYDCNLDGATDGSYVIAPVTCPD